MKKFIMLIACLAFAMIAQAQITTLIVTPGDGTDSIQDNVNTYFYVNGVKGTTNSTLGNSRVKAANPITQYALKSILIGTVHGAVAGSGDSTRFYLQGSLDNTNWVSINMVGTAGTSGTLTLSTGDMYDYSSGYYATLDGTMVGHVYYTDAQMPCYPYYRFLVDNDATGHKFPLIYVTLKKLN